MNLRAFVLALLLSLPLWAAVWWMLGPLFSLIP